MWSDGAIGREGRVKVRPFRSKTVKARLPQNPSKTVKAPLLMSTAADDDDVVVLGVVTRKQRDAEGCAEAMDLEADEA